MKNITMMKSALTHGLTIILAALFLLASKVSSFSQNQSIMHHSRKSSLASSFIPNNMRISWNQHINHRNLFRPSCFPAVNSFPTILRNSNADEPDFTSSSDNDDNDEFGTASSTADDNNNVETEAMETSFAQSLSERISQIQQSESKFVSGLQRRVQRVAKAEELDMAMSYEKKNDETTESPYGENLEEDPSSSGGRNHNSIIVSLPVISFDALLPNQRLQGSTTDPTFCNFLRSLGLGGSFVMTSVNTRQRKIRRFGVVARIELVDVEGDDIHDVVVDADNGDGNNDATTGSKRNDGGLGGLLSSPTAVTFSIVGTRRCEILGPMNGMQSRIGRWRRGYDPDGEESRLGWGDERFVDRVEELTLQPSQIGVSNKNSEHSTQQSSDITEWTNNQILIIDESSEDIHATTSAIGNATHTILPLITQWLSLASNPQTYDNTSVVASTRRKSGEPGLVVNPTALLKRVQEELGPMPPPERPTALAVWGAGLLNPLPALGVAPEVRGAVLEAHGAEGKLKVLERGLWRSIGNLDGSRPLGM